jgi:hypothetical protein
MATQQIQKAVPVAVRRQIADHVRNRARAAKVGWKSAPTSEDTLTGDLGASLRTDWSDRVEAEGYFWRWRVTYRKLGAGNQKSSEEKPTGSDGVFQVEVKRYKVGVRPAMPGTVSLENVEQEYEFRKGVLFQAKRYDTKEGPEKLLEEVKTIELLTPGDGLYLEYGPSEYRTALAKDVCVADGQVSRVSTERFTTLGDFLADQFMECLVGVEGLYVDLDADPQILHFPEESPAVRNLGVRLGHALTVQVSAFRMERFTQESDDE